MKRLALTLVLGSGSVAHAAIFVSSATVEHRFLGNQAWGIPTTTPLNNASTGNHFNTWDGRAGVSLDINESSGRMEVRSWGEPNAMLGANGDPFISQVAPQGTLRFTAIDGDFTISSTSSGSNWHSGTYRLTSVLSGEYREFRMLSYGIVQTGSLTMPAPAGEYVLTFAGGQSQMMNNTHSGGTWIDFAITPEPTALASVFALSALLRRR